MRAAFRWPAATLLVALLLLAPEAQADEPWGPTDWGGPVEPPVVDQLEGEVPGHRWPLVTGGSAGFMLRGVVHFHQRFISPHDGPRCPMYPVCSRFSMDAMRRYGPLVGLLMTVDRLFLRENPSMGRFYPFEEIEPGLWRYVDPIEHNYIFADSEAAH